MTSSDKDKIRKLLARIDELEKQLAAVEKEKREFMHEMLSLVKRREINVHHTKRKIRTVPWLTGYERTKEIQQLEEERKRKKKKMRG